MLSTSRSVYSLLGHTARRTFSTSTTTYKTMPLYIAFCPDNRPVDLSKRLGARKKHLEIAAKTLESGNYLFGRGFLSDEYTHKESTQPPVVEQGSPNPGMEGSVMVFRYPNIEACWARIKSDPYWVQNVWDKEKLTVKELLDGPTDDTMKVV